MDVRRLAVFNVSSRAEAKFEELLKEMNLNHGVKIEEIPARGLFQEAGSAGVETFGTHVQKVTSRHPASEDVAAVQISTNPFTSMSPWDADAEPVDSQSYLENLLAKSESGTDYSLQLQPSSTNPFLYEDHLIFNDSDTSYSSQDNSYNTIIQDENFARTRSEIGAPEIDQVCDLVNDVQLESVEPRANQDCLEKRDRFQKYFDRRKWVMGEKISLRITTIYSPTTFWIVPRYKELEYFLDYLYEKYSANRRALLPTELLLNMNCVVAKKNFYYRAILVSFLPGDGNKVSVFLVDYGAVISVLRDQIYELDDILLEVPHFSVRASLAFISPKYHSTWSSEAVNRFDSLTSNKILIAEVAGVDSCSKILQLSVCLLAADGIMLKCVNKILLEEGYARYIFEKTGKYKPGCEKEKPPRYAYLYPSFEYIESGKAVANIYCTEILKETISHDMLYGD